MKPLLFALLGSSVVFAAGCDSQDDLANSPANLVAADGGEAGATVNSGTGSDPKDCTPPLEQKERCGKCGFRTRSCEPSGRFGSWGLCLDQRQGQDFCNIGETRTAACGNCGSAVDRCDPETCTWTVGQCEKEGCKIGEFDTSAASCTTPGEVRNRQCSTTCAWSEFSSCGPRKGWFKMSEPPILGRVGHVAVWTGTAMIVWGGVQEELGDAFAGIPAGLLDGASYDPTTDTWTKLPPLPDAIRAAFSGATIWGRAVWSGTEMIVWGGLKSTGDGLAYNPSTSTWRKIATAPVARYHEALVWAGSVQRMIAWGGYQGTSNLSYNQATDARAFAYDPATDQWEALTASPAPARGEPVFAWNGAELVVFSGGRIARTGVITKPAPAMRFNPATKEWTSYAQFPLLPDIGTGFGSGAAMTTEGDLYSWGGARALADFNPDDERFNRDQGASFGGTRLGAGGGWSVLPRPETTIFNGGRPPLTRQAAWFGGGRLWLWSGRSILRTAIQSGASYDPATETWTTMPQQDAPPARYAATTVWTGTRAIVWGGTAGGAGLKSGGVFVP